MSHDHTQADAAGGCCDVVLERNVAVAIFLDFYSPDIDLWIIYDSIT
jgi:hypothetical protein